MAFAVVQKSAQATGTGSTVAITTAATVVNNLVVVHIKMGDTVETCSSVTDDKGNAYILSSPVSNVIRVYQAYGVQAIGGTTTVTVHFSGAATAKRCAADEFSGGGTSNATIIDNTKTGSGNGTAVAVSTMTTVAGELVVATLAQNGTGMSWTAGASYTIYNGSNPLGLRSEYRLSSTTSETAPATSDTSAEWGEIATSFKTLSASITLTYDNSASISVAGGLSTKTLSMTIGSAAYRLLVVGVGSDHVGGEVSPSSVTVAPSSSPTSTQDLTLINFTDRADCRASLYYILAPPSGSVDIVVTWSGAITEGVICAESCSGVTNSGQPDNSTTETKFNSSPNTPSITTVANNCIIIGFIFVKDASAITVNDSQNLRTSIIGDTTTSGAMADLSKAVAGAQQFGFNYGFAAEVTVVASFAPVTGNESTGTHRMFMVF